MGYRRVRLYEGLQPETNVIGFSFSCADTVHDTTLKTFLTDRNYTHHVLDRHDESDHGKIPRTSVSLSHLEIRPPLSEEHTREFGKLCLGIIDSGNDGVIVYDNREQPCTEPYGNGKVVACN
jgi:hypothetical protein